MFIRLIKFILPLSLITATLSAETNQYFLGEFSLAGMVPAVLPQPGARLYCDQVVNPLTDQFAQTVGFIPARFREPIRLMREKGLALLFEVVEVYDRPQPGSFIRVELWVTTDYPEDLQPLIYAIPVEPSSTLLAVED